MNSEHCKHSGIIDIINDVILKIEEILLVIITVGLCVVIFWEVLCRYIFFIPTAWTEELARYLFIILTFIGSAYACANRDHIQIDIINQVILKVPGIKGSERKQQIAKEVINIIADIVTVLFLLIFNYIFWKFMVQIRKLNLTSPTMRLPMIWVYSAVFIGNVLSIFHLLVLAVKGLLTCRDLRNGTRGEDLT